MSLTNLTPRTVVPQVEHVLRNGRVPFIHGEPGIGKSSVVHKLGNQYNLQLIDHRASTSEPTDYTGLPSLDGPKAVFKPFDIFPTVDDPLPEGKNGWLLFMDEFSSAPRSIQAACYKLVLDRMVGQKKLHPKVLMVAAGNTEADRAIVVEMSTALQSRFTHFTIEPNFNEWMEDIALKEKYDSRIIAFLSANPGYLHDFRPDHQGHTFSCPRTWEFMNDYVKGLDDEQLPIYQPTYQGTITDLVATSFVTFCASVGDLPKLEDILRNPGSTFIPTDQATRWFTITMLIENLEESRIQPMLAYTSRMDMEFRVLFFRAMLAVHPEWHNNTHYRAAAAELSRYLQ